LRYATKSPNPKAVIPLAGREVVELGFEKEKERERENEMLVPKRKWS